MKIKEAMTAHPTYLNPDATLREVAEQMRDLETGVIPICDGEKILGMVTDRDIALGLAEGFTQDSKASEVMCNKVFYCFQDEDIQEASDSMGKLLVRRLIVLDNRENKKLVGIISMGDIARCSHDLQLCGEIVDKVSRDSSSFSHH